MGWEGRGEVGEAGSFGFEAGVGYAVVESRGLVFWSRMSGFVDGVDAVGVAYSHAEARGKGFDRAGFGVDELGKVVDCHAAFAGGLVEEGAELGDAVVGVVAGAEVHDGGPVVGEVVCEGAGGAGGEGGWVVGEGVHGGVEGVASDDLVDVGGAKDAGVDETLWRSEQYRFGG